MFCSNKIISRFSKIYVPWSMFYALILHSFHLQSFRLMLSHYTLNQLPCDEQGLVSFSVFLLLLASERYLATRSAYTMMFRRCVIFSGRCSWRCVISGRRCYPRYICDEHIMTSFTSQVLSMILIVVYMCLRLHLCYSKYYSFIF